MQFSSLVVILSGEARLTRDICVSTQIFFYRIVVIVIVITIVVIIILNNLVKYSNTPQGHLQLSQFDTFQVNPGED